MRWFFRREQGIPEYKVENVLDSATTVRGNLTGARGFRIDGNVEGNVETQGPVVVGASGSVRGNIRASNVVVLGKIDGHVETAGHLEIGPLGKLVGDIHVGSLRMHRGGLFHGISRMPTGAGLGTAPLPGSTARTLPPPGDAAVPPPPVVSEPPPAAAPPSPDAAPSSPEVLNIEPDPPSSPAPEQPAPRADTPLAEVRRIGPVRK